MAINSKLIRGTEHFVIATYCFNSVVIKVCGNVYLSRFSLFFLKRRGQIWRKAMILYQPWFFSALLVGGWAVI